jgi:hypothetical protein
MSVMSRQKDALKCTECGECAHRGCAHLVPHFCGLGGDMIVLMLKAIENADRSRRSKAVGGVAQSDSMPRIPPNVIHSGPMSDTFVTTNSSNDMLGVDLGGNSVDMTRHGSIAPVPMAKVASNAPIPKNVGLNDFSFVAVLGKGNFGKVMLAEERWNKKM